MDGMIEPLVSLSQLKTDYLNQIVKDKSQQPSIQYDTLSDTLMLLFVSPRIETVVHFLDKHVALLFRPDTLDIVGLQIDNFEYSFIPQHEAVRRVWRLREANLEIEWPEDFGDIALMAERMKPGLLLEIMRAAEPALDELGELAQSLKEAARLAEPV